jgi:glycosyltransferase involved in cell wall biosynthesis
MCEEGILYDLSEFLNCPLRTGIQRVTFEILAHWPAGLAPLLPVILTPSGQAHLLPPETFGLMATFFGRTPGDPGAAREQLLALAARAAQDFPPTDPVRALAFFNPELFFNDWRPAAYHQLLDRMGDRFFFLVYDFLPWLCPWWFSKGVMHQIPIMDFLRLVRRVEHVAFISEATRQAYLKRIVRSPRRAGPVFALGGDGLGVAAPSFSPEKRRFTAVGSVEPRKNLGPVLRAFASLWEQGVEARLTVVGRMIGLPAEDRRLFDDLRQNERQFEWRENLDDGQVRAVITASRATVFVSQGEGFGIPPLESLALGVPVIVFDGVPSLDAVEPHGQVRLSVPDADSVRQAVLEMLDDDYARAKAQEIAGLHVPTWGELACDIEAWVEGVLSGAAAVRPARAALPPLWQAAA